MTVQKIDLEKWLNKDEIKKFDLFNLMEDPEKFEIDSGRKVKNKWIRDMVYEVARLRKRNAELEDALEKAKEGVSYYADQENWIMYTGKDGDSVCKIIKDEGQAARKILKQIEEVLE